MARTRKQARLAAATSSAANREQSTLSGAGGKAESADQRDWTGLLPELLSKVADDLLLTDVAEYIRLRSVCKPWRVATADPSLLQPRFFPRNWMMLADNEDGQPHRFINVQTGAALQIHLPTPHEYSYHGSAEGLLVLYHKLTDTVCLLNPLMMEFTDLPATCTMPGRIIFHADNITAAGVVVDEEGEGQCQPTVVLCVTEGRHSAMFYAKPRDILWAAVDVSCVDDGEGELPAFKGGLAVRGRFYVPTRSGDVLAVELKPQPHLAYVVRQEERWSGFGMRSSYLVPSLDVDADDNDGMLLVRSFVGSDLDFDAFDAFGVNVAERRLTQLLHLGDRTVFLPSLTTLRSDKFPALMEEPGTVHENDDVEGYIV